MTGTLYAGGQLDSHAGSRSQPEFIDDQHVDAMQRVAANNTADARFVVLGDAAGWFPHRTNGTILIGPWGVEWESPRMCQSQLQ